jgi:hypothetical protein
MDVNKVENLITGLNRKDLLNNMNQYTDARKRIVTVHRSGV